MGKKKRLAKIKPFSDPDSLDSKKVVVIEDDDDDGFKFPKFKFPSLGNQNLKNQNHQNHQNHPDCQVFKSSFDFDFPGG